MSLPDAFGLPAARRVVDGDDGRGRDLREAVLGQMHPRMRDAARARDVDRFAAKYAAPLAEFPDTWDAALLAVYRADAGGGDDRGRALLAAAKGACRFAVLTGDSDGVVPPGASKIVADALGTDCDALTDVGHLPMDEAPDALAAGLLRFIQGGAPG